VKGGEARERTQTRNVQAESKRETNIEASKRKVSCVRGRIREADINFDAEDASVIEIYRNFEHSLTIRFARNEQTREVLLSQEVRRRERIESRK
jgi:hypothetical protein